MTGVYGCQQDGRGTKNNSLWYRGRALCGQVCKVFLLFMFIHPHYVKSDCNAFETALPPNMRIPSLPETTPAGYSLFNVTLTSSDQVTLDQANPPGFFVFNITNKINYNLQLKQNLDLESLSPGVASVSVRVVCNPGNWKSTLRIQISAVNEFPPMFIDSPYQVNVSEMTPIGTTVFNLANRVRDPDNTMNPIQMLYTIDGSDAFRIDGTAVVTNRTFDYDLGTKKYIVNLTATERTPERKSNSTELTISILNEDDLNPKFTQELYNITLDEGNYSTALFNSNPAIHAVDPDSGNSLGVQYSLINGTGYDYGNLFTLLLNGSLKVSGHVGLNPPVYSLSIKAFQTDRPKERYDTATLFITVRDINDHAPIMSKKFYTARVAENSPSGFIVLEVSASDEDTGRNGVFEFDLVQQGSLFDIQTIGTKGWLRVRGSLDREHDSTQTIQVYAKETLTAEHRQSPLSNITIIVTDVNDNSPVFSNTSYNFQIQKNASIGKTIGMVSATDIDEGKNGSVTYEIQGTQADWFSIHNTTGIISVHLNLSDVSAGPIYFFVIAQDQAPKPYIRQTIVPVIVEILDVNTSPPIFINITNPVYISENQGKGALLLQLSAKDPDRSANGKLTYTINEGNSNGTFTINTRRGLITLRKMLDRETCPSYNLTVQVSDGELTSSTVIEVLVRDLNDNAPQFTQRIYIFNITEEQAAPAVVGHVIAHDRDEGRNKEITFQSLGIPFDMNATTGVITTKGPLDRENLTSYSFFVMATDRGQPPLSSVSQIEVNVKDINDNPPVFDPSIVKLKYNEGMMLSFTTQAHDRDSGENKLVKYFKEDGDTLFSVSSDGLVVSTALLKHGQFNVTVVAYNTEPYTCNCKNATLTLIIDVSDINNNPPVFNSKLYNKTIPEGRYTNKPPILTVAATDNDTDATFVYKIISGNNNSTFYLNPISGSLYPRRELDYDPPVNDREFNLTVQAVDPSDKEKNDITQVLIYITDTNDNSPIFDRAQSTTGNPIRNTTAGGYVTRSDVVCSATSFTFAIPDTVLPQHNVTLRDPACVVVFNGSHYVATVGLNDCGTTVQFTKDSVIFRNELSAHVSHYNFRPGPVSFGDAGNLFIPVECVYPRRANVSMAYLPLHSKLRIFEKRYGHLDFELTEFSDDQFQSEIPSTSLPKQLPLNQELHIKLSIGHSSSSKIGIYVDNCLATPTPSPNYPVFWPLLKNGCSYQPELHVHHSSSLSEFLFSFNAFKFVSTNPMNMPSLVYVHCQVSACYLANCATSCQGQGQTHSRRRRGAMTHSSHLVSTGPFILLKDQESSPQSAGVIVSTSVAAVACLVAVVAVVAWRINRTNQQKYHVVQHDLEH